MKTITAALLVVALGCFGSTCRAQTTDQSSLQLLADKAKETRPVVRVSPWAGPSYGAYLPVWTFHAKYDVDASGKIVKDPFRQYVTIGGGGKYDTATKSGNGFLAVEFNAVALSARAWDWSWARDHVDRSKFPSVWGGVSPDLPLAYRDAQAWTFRKNWRYQFSVAYPF